MRVCEQFLSGSNKCNDDDDVGIRNKRKGKTEWGSIQGLVEPHNRGLPVVPNRWVQIM